MYVYNIYNYITHVIRRHILYIYIHIKFYILYILYNDILYMCVCMYVYLTCTGRAFAFEETKKKRNANGSGGSRKSE